MCVLTIVPCNTSKRQSDHTIYYRNSTGDTIAEIKRTGIYSKTIEVFSVTNDTELVATLKFPLQVSERVKM